MLRLLKRALCDGWRLNYGTLFPPLHRKPILSQVLCPTSRQPCSQQRGIHARFIFLRQSIKTLEQVLYNLKKDVIRIIIKQIEHRVIGRT